MNDQLVVMNDDTDYVHTHVVNFEPTYLALMHAVDRWRWDGSGPISPYAEDLQNVVERNVAAMGLHPRHLTDRISYSAMIQFEAGV